MSEIISKAGKIAAIAVVALFIVAFISFFTVNMEQVLSGTPLSGLPTILSQCFKIGRELANNFIPPYGFNACVALWLGGSSILLADYVVTVIGGKIADVR